MIFEDSPVIFLSMSYLAIKVLKQVYLKVTNDNMGADAPAGTQLMEAWPEYPVFNSLTNFMFCSPISATLGPG